MEQIKLCKDCKYCKKEVDYYCTRKINPVDGQKQEIRCEQERMIEEYTSDFMFKHADYLQLCKPEGIYFEPKED